MSARAWEAILAAWSDLDATLTATLPSGEGGGKDAFEPRLSELREALCARLAQLTSRLRSILSAEARMELSGDASSAGSEGMDALIARRADDEVEQVIVPLAIHVDERVLGRLPPRIGSTWVRVQEDVIHSDDGGVVFYEKLDALLASVEARALVLEVYLFCLCEGFFGRYIDEPERINGYRDRIAQRLPRPATSSSTTSTTSTTTTDTKGSSTQAASKRRVLPAPAYYVIALVAAALVIALLHWLAR